MATLQLQHYGVRYSSLKVGVHSLQILNFLKEIPNLPKRVNPINIYICTHR